MSINNCDRCGRDLIDPQARYGWRCEKIMGGSTTSSFAKFLSDRYLEKYDIDPKYVNLSRFYAATEKTMLSRLTDDEAMRREALLEAYTAMGFRQDDIDLNVFASSGVRPSAVITLANWFNTIWDNLLDSLPSILPKSFASEKETNTGGSRGSYGKFRTPSSPVQPEPQPTDQRPLPSTSQMLPEWGLPIPPSPIPIPPSLIPMATPTPNPTPMPTPAQTISPYEQLKRNPAPLKWSVSTEDTYAGESDVSVIARMLYGENHNSIEGHLWVLENRRIAGNYGGKTYRTLVTANNQFSCMNDPRSLDPVSQFGGRGEQESWEKCVDYAILLTEYGIDSIEKPNEWFPYTYTHTLTEKIKRQYPNGWADKGTWYFNKQKT